MVDASFVLRGSSAVGVSIAAHLSLRLRFYLGKLVCVTARSVLDGLVERLGLDLES